jgi:hypothetical protein
MPRAGHSFGSAPHCFAVEGRQSVRLDRGARSSRTSSFGWLWCRQVPRALLLFLLLSMPVAAFGQIIGPDNQPLPGSDGQPLPQPATPPETPAFGGFEADAKADMDANPGKPTGTVVKKSDGATFTITWKRTGELTWTYSVKVEVAGQGVVANLAADVTNDGGGASHAKMTQMATLPGERRRYGPAYIFVIAPGGCTDLKVIQYIERTDTLLNASGKTVQKSTMGPGIDGGIPYSPQGTIGGNLVSQDAPGISGPAGQHRPANGIGRSRLDGEATRRAPWPGRIGDPRV